MTTAELVRKLPKVDLHCHIDGSVRTSTLMHLAKKHGFKLPTNDVRKFEKYVKVSPKCKSLTEFLNRFEFFYDFLKFPDAVERISYELTEDVSKENVKYLEARFAPHLQANKNFKAAEVVKIAVDALNSGARKNKIKAGIIICIYRNLPDEANDEAIKLAEKYFGKGVVGIDLAGDEILYPTEKFIKYFDYARSRSIPITCHAGEAGSAESIRPAVESHIQRIGHGTHLYQDENLLQLVKNNGIALEVCLTSNVQTKVVKSYGSHPFRKYFAGGLKVTLNTDDRSVSGIDLTHEHLFAMKHYGLKISDLIKLTLNSVSALFLSESEKREIEGKLKKEISEILKNGAEG
ncbi:MAG: adenosine deaminase [Elusimicrobiota bacterium]